MRRPWLGWFLAFVLALVLLELLRANADDADYIDLAQQRYAHAQRAKELEIAVVTAAGEDMLWNGARDAAARVNAAGGVRGRKLRVERFRVDPRDEGARARMLARTPRFVAVIGHSAAHAKEAAVSYEATDTLFLATSATDPRLTRFAGARVVTRLVPDDQAVARAIAAALRISAIESVGILYTRATASTDVERLIGELLAADLDVAFTHPYDSIQELRLTMLRQDSLAQTYGAVVLLGEVPSASAVLARLRATRMRPAILTTSPELAAPCVAPPTSGRLQRGHAYAITTFCGGDARAAHGYEAVSVLAQAIARAESPAPTDVAAVIRSGALFESIGGKLISFTPNGDVEGKQLFITSARTNR